MTTTGDGRGGLRDKILEVAFREFYTHGFQGGSVNRIIDSARTTKGAFFHHFENKHAIGHAVIDEVITPLMKKRWLAPIASSINLIPDLQSTVSKLIKADIQSGSYLKGCPLNNFAQEMSPIDEAFRQRIDAVYRLWRESLSAALNRGIKMAQVRNEIDPTSAAAFIVAAQMGIWGSAKSSRSADLMQCAGHELCGYLDRLALSVK